MIQHSVRGAQLHHGITLIAVSVCLPVSRQAILGNKCTLTLFWILFLFPAKGVYTIHNNSQTFHSLSLFKR